MKHFHWAGLRVTKDFTTKLIITIDYLYNTNSFKLGTLTKRKMKMKNSQVMSQHSGRMMSKLLINKPAASGSRLGGASHTLIYWFLSMY